MNTRRLPFDKEGCPYGLERLLFDFYGLAKLSWLGNVSGDAKGCPKIPILEFFCEHCSKGGRGEGGSKPSSKIVLQLLINSKGL